MLDCRWQVEALTFRNTQVTNWIYLSSNLENIFWLRKGHFQKMQTLEFLLPTSENLYYWHWGFFITEVTNDKQIVHCSATSTTTSLLAPAAKNNSPSHHHQSGLISQDCIMWQKMSILSLLSAWRRDRSSIQLKEAPNLEPYSPQIVGKVKSWPPRC